MTDYKTNIKKILIMIFICIVISTLSELFFNLKVLNLKNFEKGTYEIDTSNAQIEGFVKYENAFKVADKDALFKVNFKEQYINKLRIEYTTPSSLYFILRIYMTDSYGNSSFIDKNFNHIYNNIAPSNRLNHMTIYIGKKASSFEIITNENTPLNATINKLSIQNNFVFNWFRFLLIFFSILTFLSIAFYRRLFEKKVEVGFFITSTLIGIIYIASMPINPNSYDEHIHFNRSYITSFFFSNNVTYSEGAYEMATLSTPTTFSYEDRIDSIKYLRSAPNATTLSKKDSHLMTQGGATGQIGYINQSLGIFIANKLDLSFPFVFYFGKIFNLLTYIILIFFAIKTLPCGKMILVTMSLLPFPMLMATSYTYDTPVFASTVLGLSIILTEFMVPNKKITLKQALIFLIAIGFSSLAKQMVYAPFLLLGLFLNESKFKDKKSMYLFKIAIFITIVIVLIIIGLPTILNPKIVADTRGGDTSQSRQISLIMHNMHSYVEILLKSIITTFDDFLIGKAMFPTFPYHGTSAFEHLITILLIFVIITDVNPEYHLSIKNKILIALISFISICLIWTALYIDFTPVGSNTINGVQQRYYLPFIIAIYLLFNTDKIANNFPKIIYRNAIFAICACFSLYTMYSLILKTYCF